MADTLSEMIADWGFAISEAGWIPKVGDLAGLISKATQLEQELATLREQLAAAKKPWSGALQLQLADMTKERDQARAERDLANEKIADLQCDVANLNDRLEKQPANDENFILLQNNLLAVIDERDQAKRDKERLLSALNGLMNAVDADQSQLDKTSAFDSAYRRANEAIDASMENKTDE